ncbi:MAG TPA: glycoside hydrolase family 16 protein, partial [Anaerolineales bacterium]|nr:glycoside hydrolase family 16 protein [Anaerolineales bacterium]
LWMIGFEDKPEYSAEICIFELKGYNIKKKSALIGYGVHPFGDPSIKDEFYEEEFSLDVTQFNTYAAEWTEREVHFYINDQKIRTIQQSPQYPMQFMLNIYDLSKSPKHDRPMQFIVDYVSGYTLSK